MAAQATAGHTEAAEPGPEPFVGCSDLTLSPGSGAGLPKEGELALLLPTPRTLGSVPMVSHGWRARGSPDILQESPHPEQMTQPPV